ncbi:MAG: hypothetical protein SFV18_22240 [Bryobacteraceae bacterium]|nr:hypothetical protein [Bryobacteraceae bacterium]
MTPITRRSALAALGGGTAVGIAQTAAPDFEVRYWLDKDGEAIEFADLHFLSERRGLALGAWNVKGRVSGCMVSTNDAGANWTVEKLPEIPLSAFFLNDSLGWMVTMKGVWRSDEGGRSWRKVKGMQGAIAVHFTDERRGFLVGVPKLFLETADGGRTWTKVPGGQAVTTREETTAFTTVSLIRDSLGRDIGLVTGYSSPPPRRLRFGPDLPPWLDPKGSRRRFEQPNVLVVIESVDGGKSWKPSTSSIFGKVSRVAVGARGSALAIVKFGDTFDYPGEVFRIDLSGGKSTRVFRDKTRLPLDVEILADGSATLATVEPATAIRGIPIPGKLFFYRSEGAPFDRWEPTTADYRAVAQGACLAADPSGTVWTATSESMILAARPTNISPPR